MQFGAIFPQTEIGNDPEVIRAYGSGAEEAGFDYVAAYDHVLGADPDRPGGLGGPYTHETTFHEVFVLFAHLAACTTRVEMVTEVLVLPQRQTALVAKQAASLDVLSGGRVRLGVGIGWNRVEYELLGMRFEDRGRRIEEQIAVLRLLWSQDIVEFRGRDHVIDRAGIRPRPVRGTIPVWMGGGADPVLRRAARLADGWMANVQPDRAATLLPVLRRYLEDAGRDPATFGICGRVNHRGDLDASVATGRAWSDLGATHISVNTMNAGLRSGAEHLDHARRVLEALTS